MPEDIFVLKIALGNDAMQTGGDVAGALRATADKIDSDGDFDSRRYGYVKDENGNQVGSWGLE